jgi:hypothetical protein
LIRIGRRGVTGRSPRAIRFLLVVLLNAALFAASAPRAQAGALTASPNALNFGNVVVGQSQITKIMLKNSGTSALILSGGAIGGTGFSLTGISYPQTLGVGAEILLNVEFAPAKAGYVTGTAEIFIKGSGYAEITMKGTGIAGGATGYLSASPLSAQFQNVPVGTRNTQIIQLTNTGSTNLTISNVTTTGNGFSASGVTTPLSMAAGATVQLTVGFLPNSVGSSGGSVVLTSTASDSQMTIVLAGTGVGNSRVLEVSPASLSFGNVILNGSATQQFTMTNAGNSNISISGGSINGTGLSATGVVAETLSPGQSAVVTAQFAPKTAGSVSGGITILSNASNGASITVPVTGAGVTAARAVTLQWQHSTSTGVIGYYVYRSTVSGGPYTKVASSLVSGTSYSDTNVISGLEYYYVVTAVSANGSESAYSAQVAVSVP